MIHPRPRSILSLTTLLIIFAILQTPAARADSGPDFGPNVLIFDPSMKDIQARVDRIYRDQERAEFGRGRYALLFKPGKYELDVRLGFYMDAAGLGRSPDDVSITGAVRALAGWAHGNATVNFWRAIENLSITPTYDRNIDVWAVSQGAALRRVHVRGNMNLWDGGWSSGGFLADCKIDGQIVSGSQQQWLSRNADWGAWRGGVWNMVFVGVNAPPSGQWPQHPYTVVDQTPVIREKPYLTVDEAGKFFVMAPPTTANTRGITWETSGGPGTAIPLDQFYLAHAGRDTAQTINAALQAGKNLLLTPGIYDLQNSIRVSRPNTIVLGLGYPTLVADGGQPAIVVSDVDGVSLAAMILQAGKAESDTLLQVGQAGASGSHAKNPTCLYDIFTRCGGAAPGSTKCMVTLNSNDVIGDNFWLWRADHGIGVGWNLNRNANGLIVNGQNVTIYGLAVEHTQEYQTLWNANGGRVYFYQSEMPYDPPSQAAWSHDGIDGYASYKVSNNVVTHEAWGLGIYSVFLAAPVLAENAIETPTGPGIQMHHIVTLRLTGKPGSGIAHVINGQGASATIKGVRVD